MALLAEYSFNEASGNVLDLTGNGHDFALNGGLQRVTTGGTDPTGYAGKGLGTTDGTADNGPAAFGQTASRTICFWLRSTATFTGWVAEMHLTSGNTGRWGLLELGGQEGFRGTNTGFSTAHAAQAAVSDGAWHFWAGTYDGSNVRLYHGTAVGSLSLVSTVALASPLLTDADVLRMFTTAGTGNIIRHLRLYDTALDLAALITVMGQPAGGSAGTTMSLGAATGSGSPQALAAAKALTVGAAGGTGAPQAMSFSKPLTFGAATGTGTPQSAAFIAAGLMRLDPATGTGAAQAMSFTKGLRLGLAGSSGTPHAMTFGGPTAPYTAAAAGAVAVRPAPTVNGYAPAYRAVTRTLTPTATTREPA